MASDLSVRALWTATARRAGATVLPGGGGGKQRQISLYLRRFSKAFCMQEDTIKSMCDCIRELSFRFVDVLVPPVSSKEKILLVEEKARLLLTKDTLAYSLTSVTSEEYSGD